IEHKQIKFTRTRIRSKRFIALLGKTTKNVLHLGARQTPRDTPNELFSAARESRMSCPALKLAPNGDYGELECSCRLCAHSRTPVEKTAQNAECARDADTKMAAK